MLAVIVSLAVVAAAPDGGGARAPSASPPSASSPSGAPPSGQVEEVSAEPDEWSALAVIGAAGVGGGALVAYLGVVPLAVGLVFYDSGADDVDIRVTYALLAGGGAVIAVGAVLLLAGTGALLTDVVLDLLE